MGGGDLNLKKSWHPATLANIEKVWLEEQKALEEEKKVVELEKELRKQREIEELRKMQEQATGK